LIDRKIHLPALDRLSLDFVPRFAEGREDLVLWVIDNDVSIREIKDARTTVRKTFVLP
jgi:hypothetical protein